MISNIFSGSDSGEKTLPRDVKEAVSKCRNAVQEALKNRVSRMDVEFPVGTKFNVEKGTTKRNNKNKAGDGGVNTPTRQDLDTSDRELARLFVDMFQPVGGDRITVAFTDVELANAAKQKWKGDPTAVSRIVSMDRRRSSAVKKKKKKVKAKGFAAKLAAEIGDSSENSDSVVSDGPFELPNDTEVALFVSPGPKELVIIEKICRTVGMGTLVVLLNARLSMIDSFGTPTATKLFTEDFESVFSLAAAPQEAAPGCLLYRAYPESWVLARKPAVGQPKTIMTTEDRPTLDECRKAVEGMELSELEKGVENVAENVANWFR